MTQLANPPYSLQVEITSRCNLACPMCPLTSGGTASSHSVGHMSDAVWAEVLAAAPQCNHIYIAGFGEPLTNPKCLPMMAQLDALGVSTTFVTNGLAMSRRKAAELTALPSVAHINVSIDSPDAGVYAAVRGGALSGAVRGLQALMATGVQQRRVSVSTVVAQENIASLHAMPALLANAGVSHWVLQGLVDYNEHGRAQRLRDAPLAGEIIRDLRASCRRLGIDITLTMPDRLDLELRDEEGADRRYFALAALPAPATTRQCMVPWELPYIDKDGTVFACCFSASMDDRPLGSLAAQSLAQVWDGPAYRGFRRDLRLGTSMPDSCRVCTSVPLGVHPLERYGAELVSVRRGHRSASLIYRNTGVQTWSAADGIRLGTARPRDAISPVTHARWLIGNRPATHREAEVAPGECAAFTFLIQPAPAACELHLELLAEGTCWLPGTHVTLAVQATGLRDTVPATAVCLAKRLLPPGLRQAAREAVDRARLHWARTSLLRRKAARQTRSPVPPVCKTW